MCPSLNSGALAVLRQPKNSGAATVSYQLNKNTKRQQILASIPTV